MSLTFQAAADGTVYVADTSNQAIRKVTTAGVVTTLAGSTQGFADSVVVSSVVYTGTALSYTDTALVVGTSYTYTVTAVGPGTVSNTIGPFVRAAPTVVSYQYTGADQTFTVPAGVTDLGLQVWGGENADYGNTGGYAAGHLAVSPGEVITIRLVFDSYWEAYDAYILRSSVTYLCALGGDNEWSDGTGWVHADLTNTSTSTGGSTNVAAAITYQTP